MKIFFASASWFLGAWIVFDIAAFAMGMPRSLTPVVAVAVASAVWMVLRSRPADGSVADSRTSSSAKAKTVVIN